MISAAAEPACSEQGELDELEREEFFRLKKVQGKKQRDAEANVDQDAVRSRSLLVSNMLQNLFGRPIQPELPELLGRQQVPSSSVTAHHVSAGQASLPYISICRELMSPSNPSP